MYREEALQDDRMTPSPSVMASTQSIGTENNLVVAARNEALVPTRPRLQPVIHPAAVDRRAGAKRRGGRISQASRALEPLPPGIELTSREMQVLCWISAGKSDWEIGKILHIAAKTVNFHAQNAKKKLGVSTRVQAAIMAVSAGLLDQSKRLAPEHNQSVRLMVDA